MTYLSRPITTDRQDRVAVPAWMAVNSSQTIDHVVFLSGAAFALLDAALRAGEGALPEKLLASVLAVKAAVATAKLEGRIVSEADVRDAFYLTPPGGALGPDGDALVFWRSCTQLRLRHAGALDRACEMVADSHSDQFDEIIRRAVKTVPSVGPIETAVSVMRDVMAIDHHAERIACLIADVAIARYFGWGRPLPLTALHMSKRTLRELGDGQGGGRTEVAMSLTKSAQAAHALAHHLTVRANAIRAIAPKLRAKGSDDAVALFLTEEAVSPSGMLAPRIKGTRTPMTGRAARRLCDRLVELGVAKELTGRATFRLYGIAA